MKSFKCITILLLLVCLAFAQNALQPLIKDWALAFESLLIGFAMLAVIIAAAAYAIGQIFGAETRASIQAWAQSLLAAGVISIIVLAVLYFVLPGWLNGQYPSAGGGYDLGLLLRQLNEIATQALSNIIILLILLAASAYAIGQIFGSETRARANNWAQTLITAAVIAAFLYVVIFQLITAIAFNLPVAIEAGYKSIVAITVLFVGVIVLITYLASKVLRIPEWEAYLTIELSDLVTSFMIVLVVVGIFTVGDQFALSLIKSDAKSTTEAAIHVMGGIIRNVENGRNDAYTIQMCTSILSTFHKRTGESVLNITYKIFPGVDIFSTLAGMLATGFIMLEASLKAQLLLLQLIQALALPLLLPAGIILRFFPPTKEAGAFILALMIGFYVIFPLTYLINNAAFEDIGIKYQPPSALKAMICGADLFAATLPVMLVPKLIGVFSSKLAVTSTLFLGPLFNEGTLLLFKVSEFMVIVDSFTVLSLFGFFAPSISMVFTVAFINAMTKFIVSRW
ncbi:MAG: hypothetical protein V1492_02325 [Candidatus Micrarchaeota archaeon]